MASSTWIDGSANWNTTADWAGGIPTATSDVVVAQGAPEITSAIKIASLLNSAKVVFANAGASAISVSVTNSGTLALDAASGQRDSGLTIGGVLTNTGIVRLGAADNSLSVADTVSAAKLVNAGRLEINGGVLSSAKMLLHVKSGVAGFGTAGVLSGTVDMSGNAELEFGAGKITSIHSGGELSLTGAKALITDSLARTSNSALTGLNLVAGALALVDGAALATTGPLTNLYEVDLGSHGVWPNSRLTVGGALTNLGFVDVDSADGQGGSTLWVNGVLTNGGVVKLGNSALAQSSLMNVGALVNSQNLLARGELDLVSDTTTAAQTLLNVRGGSAGFGTAGVLSGNVNLSGNSAIEFVSGQIGDIRSDAELTLVGPLAYVEDAGALNTNSALKGLNSVDGTLTLDSGSTIATNGGLSISGTVNIDYLVYSKAFATKGYGGSSLTIGGVLTNTGNLIIGSPRLTQSDSVTTTGLVNESYLQSTPYYPYVSWYNPGIFITGGASTAATALLNVTGGVAGFGTAGVLSGDVQVSGNAEIRFSSGQIDTIAPGSDLYLSGPSAYVADAAASNSNSALKGLSLVEGQLWLLSGAKVATSGGLQFTTAKVSTSYVSSGTMRLDTIGDGGSSLTVGGVLTISAGPPIPGNLAIGNSAMTQSDALTTAGLVNNGSIDLEGGASPTAQSLLKVTSGLAGFGTAGVLSGTVSLSGNAAIRFAGGQIIRVADSLTLNGPAAFIADAAAPNTNSALRGLKLVQGSLVLASGAAITTNGGLANKGWITLDSTYFPSGIGGQGGSSLTVAGALTNSANLALGNSGMTRSEVVTAAEVLNTGSIDLVGGAAPTAQALLKVTSGLAGFGTAGVLNGTASLSGNAAVRFAGGQITNVAGSLALNGPSTFIADAAAPNSNSALRGLKLVSGTLALASGADVTTSGGLQVKSPSPLGGTGRMTLDTIGNGGSSLTIGGVLTIGESTIFQPDLGTLSVGNSAMTQSDVVTAAGLVNNGLINLIGGATPKAQALLKFAGALTNNGTFALTSDAETISGAVSGTGSFSLASASTLEFDSSVEMIQHVNFSGADELVIGENQGVPAAQKFAASIGGFGKGDSIDVKGFAATAFTYTGAGLSSGILTLTDASNNAAKFSFSGSYTTSEFSVSVSAGDSFIKFV